MSKLYLRFMGLMLLFSRAVEEYSVDDYSVNSLFCDS